jgi:superoxide dismutase, Fe-Mn family
MVLTRRSLLLAGGAAAALSTFGTFLPRTARAAAPFAQPPLPFPENALAPTISAQTVQLHYGKHHKGYYDTLNKLVAGTPYEAMSLDQIVVAAKDKDQKVFNNAGQAWNHVLYWEEMVPGGPKAPAGALSQAIERDFGGFDAFKTKFVEAATGQFGSGWAWLIDEGGKLAIMTTSNGDNPLAHGKKTLMGVDVWEHAYYLDYQNRRADHVKAVLDKAINWSYVANRMAA